MWLVQHIDVMFQCSSHHIFVWYSIFDHVCGDMWLRVHLALCRGANLRSWAADSSTSVVHAVRHTAGYYGTGRERRFVCVRAYEVTTAEWFWGLG